MFILHRNTTTHHLVLGDYNHTGGKNSFLHHLKANIKSKSMEKYGKFTLKCNQRVLKHHFIFNLKENLITLRTQCLLLRVFYSYNQQNSSKITLHYFKNQQWWSTLVVRSHRATEEHHSWDNEQKQESNNGGREKKKMTPHLWRNDPLSKIQQKFLCVAFRFERLYTETYFSLVTITCVPLSWKFC